MGNNLPIIKAKTSNEKVCPFDSIPTDIYGHLFQFLENIDLIVLYFVCSTFRNYIHGESGWNYEIDWEDQYFTSKTDLVTTKNWIKIYKWSNKVHLPFKKYSFYRAVNLEDLQLLKFLHKNKFGVLSSELFNCALEVGNVSILDWLFNKKCKTNTNILNAIALCPTDNSFNWLLDHADFPDFINIKKPMIIDFGKQLTLHTIEFIIGHGKINMLKWLYERSVIIHPIFIQFAAFHGQNEILDWMLNSTTLTLNDFIENEVCFHAAMGGQLNTLKFLREKNIPWGKTEDDDSVYYAAIVRDHQEIFEWALEEECPKGMFATRGAAQVGSIKLFEYLISLGFKAGDDVANIAANSGKLHMIEWLKLHGYIVDYEQICDYAALNCHIDVIEWTVERGHEPTTITLEIAAEGGHIELIEFLKENFDLEYDEKICTAAMKNKQNYCLMWLVCNDFPFSAIHSNHIINVLRKINDDFVNKIIEGYLTGELTNELCKVIVKKCVFIKN